MTTITSDYFTTRKLPTTLMVVLAVLVTISTVSYVGSMFRMPGDAPASGFKIENTSQSYKPVLSRHPSAN